MAATVGHLRDLPSLPSAPSRGSSTLSQGAPGVCVTATKRPVLPGCRGFAPVSEVILAGAAGDTLVHIAWCTRVGIALGRELR